MGIKTFAVQVDLRKIPLKGLVPEASSSAPSSPVEGQLWNDTSVTPNRLKIYENGGWVLVSNTGAELLANKNAANGYPGLTSGKIAIGAVPTAADGVSDANLVPLSNDTRLSNQRVPTDGSVTGGTAGAGVKIAATTITAANIANATITDVQVAAANKDGVAGTASMRTIGTGAQQAMAGNTTLATIAAPGGPVSLNSQRITNLATPTTGTDAATKDYVDLARQGIAGIKDPVRVASSTNVNLASPGATVDGVTMASGERFLALNQTTTTQNGIYVWNGAATPATRAPDADATGEVQDGTMVAVSEGTAAGNRYQQTATPSGAPGAWTQTWQVIQTGVTYTGSTGVELVGNDFRAKKNTTDATNPITVTADGIGLATVPIDHGGTGATTAAAARTALGIVGKYSALITNALVAGTPLNINHALNTTDILDPSFKVVADNTFVELGVVVVDANNITVQSDVAWSANTLRITVIG